MLVYSIYSNIINPIECRSNYSSAQNNTKLVHWPLMGGLLHLVQQIGAWAAHPGPSLLTKRNSSPAVDGWAVTFGTTKRGLGRAAAHPGPSLLTKRNSSPAVDEWAVTFGTTKSGLGRAAAHPGPSLLTKRNSSPINGQCTNHRIPVQWSAALQF